MARRLTAIGSFLVPVCGLAACLWWLTKPDLMTPVLIIADLTISDLATPAPTPPTQATLPVPPFPPRITQGTVYETCLATLALDPASAVAVAEMWQAGGGGDGAVHCRGLALIAAGKPAEGATLLEELAHTSVTPAMARALVLGQAAQAWLMVAQADTPPEDKQAADQTAADKAAADASLALPLSPSDTDILITLATAESMRGRFDQAVEHVDATLRIDAGRIEALVLRATLHRKLNQLDLAQADLTQALALDPDNPDALLERGILRQRTGDWAGAHADWEHARGVDPNSTTADLAEQNLSLLEAGPRRQ